MQRIPAIDPKRSTGKTRALLDRIQMEKGLVSNQLKTMAVSPAVLEAYIGFDSAIANGVLSDQVRQRIALTVAEIIGCQYSLALHHALGRLAGLSEEEIEDSRRGVTPDRKLEAVLQFVKQVVINRGRVTDADLTCLQRLGYDHEEIVEITANVMLAVFTSYFNIIAGTIRDFPKAPDLTAITEEGEPLGFQSNKPKLIS